MTDKMIILKDLKNCLQNEFPDSAREVILFGPQASGVVTDLSDFDILVVLKNKYSARDENKIYDLCYEIDLKYNILIDVHLISESELNSLKDKQPIFSKALKSGIYA
jgi:predicted nucleotidyltransferase